jgi:hypothetical protein
MKRVHDVERCARHLEGVYRESMLVSIRVKEVVRKSMIAEKQWTFMS